MEVQGPTARPPYINNNDLSSDTNINNTRLKTGYPNDSKVDQTAFINNNTLKQKKLSQVQKSFN